MMNICIPPRLPPCRVNIIIQRAYASFLHLYIIILCTCRFEYKPDSNWDFSTVLPSNQAINFEDKATLISRQNQVIISDFLFC